MSKSSEEYGRLALKLLRAVNKTRGAMRPCDWREVEHFLAWVDSGRELGDDDLVCVSGYGVMTRGQAKQRVAEGIRDNELLRAFQAATIKLPQGSDERDPDDESDEDDGDLDLAIERMASPGKTQTLKEVADELGITLGEKEGGDR